MSNVCLVVPNGQSQRWGQKSCHHREGRGINSSNRGNCTHLQSLFMALHFTTSDDIWMTGWKKRAWERSPNPAYFLCDIQLTNGRLMWAFYSDCPLWKVRKIVRCSPFKTVYEKNVGGGNSQHCLMIRHALCFRHTDALIFVGNHKLLDTQLEPKTFEKYSVLLIKNQDTLDWHAELLGWFLWEASLSW